MQNKIKKKLATKNQSGKSNLNIDNNEGLHKYEKNVTTYTLYLEMNQSCTHKAPQVH